MAAGKWIGGILGYATGGTLGMLLGIVIGSLVDSFSDGKKNFYTEKNDTDNSYNSQQQFYEGQRNSFLFSLLVLASYVVKADGKVMHSEMELVRNFLRANFGENAVGQGENIMMKLFEEQDRQERLSPNSYKRTINESCAQMVNNMEYSERLQLLNFLVMIAQADGVVCTEEVIVLKEIASYLHLSSQEVDSMLHLTGDSLEDAYKVLEVSPNATDDEVKAAYRKQALKHHPDRVATLGEDVKNAAQKKFQEINNAKEMIYKSRGI